MSDLFIIVTRMSGGGNEFESYFNDENWAGKYSNNSFLKIPNCQSELTYVQGDSIIFVDGFEVADNDDKCKTLREYILTAKKNDKIYILLHGGTNFTTVEVARNKIFQCGDGAPETIPQDIEIQRYSSTDEAIMAIVKQLAECIKNNKSDIICQTDKIKDYILKKKDNAILHLFLPLDIDMQALGILLDEKNDSKKAADYLKEMLEDSKKYHKEILSKAEELLKLISEEKKKTDVKTSFDKIRDFLGTLVELQPDKIPDFNDDKDKELKENIENFHDWYCALAEILRK